jgi:hypothetical protein
MVEREMEIFEGGFNLLMQLDRNYCDTDNADCTIFKLGVFNESRKLWWLTHSVSTGDYEKNLTDTPHIVVIRKPVRPFNNNLTNTGPECYNYDDAKLGSMCSWYQSGVCMCYEWQHEPDVLDGGVRDKHLYRLDGHHKCRRNSPIEGHSLSTIYDTYESKGIGFCEADKYVDINGSSKFQCANCGFLPAEFTQGGDFIRCNYNEYEDQAANEDEDPMTNQQKCPHSC